MGDVVEALVVDDVDEGVVVDVTVGLELAPGLALVVVAPDPDGIMSANWD